MTGKIIKGIAGFYYVDVENIGIYQCKAKGIFRNQNIKPLVGDNVVIEITHEGDMEGNIVDILPRKNELIRPLVANVDQAFIVFSVKHPDPNINLLDRFLVAVAMNQIEAVICFNKSDLLASDELFKLNEIYSQAGYKTLVMNTYEENDFNEVKTLFAGKTTVFAGPSGVGKSSIINKLQENTFMETGEVSDKIKRGKHTTRHANLILIEQNSYVVDTPGFSSLQFDQLKPDELKEYFLEFLKYEPECKFGGCNHINEPKCGVKTAFNNDLISESRYKSYLQIYDELKNVRRY